ncbi:MAG: glycosyltransferase family 39 protein [Acidobacteria bacterium]|nr:glycosyltransferase family 39 protein [Acidobacteriota bacterium]
MPRHTAAIAGVCALTFLAGLGRPAVTDSDEAYYAEAAREMIERGDWLTPHYNDEIRFEKPVLYYWLAAAAYAAGGVSPAAARLPSALAGIGLALLACACARRWYDERTALLAGIITATSFGYVAMARHALPDLPLAFFVTLATWGAIVGLRIEPSRAGDHPSAQGWLIAAGAAAAGAFLVKGPVGLVLPAAVVAPLAAWTWLRERRPRASRAALLAAVGVFLVLALPWYGAMAVEHGAAYVERFFIGENLERFATPRYNDPRPLWYYLPIVAGGLLPWTPFAVLWAPALGGAWRARRAGATEFRLAWWALAPLAFYTLSVGKQPRYVLPVLPPLAVLLAAAMRRAAAPGTERRGLLTGAAVASGLLVVLVAERLYAVRPLLVEWSGAWIPSLAGVVLVLGVAIVAAAAISHRDRSRRGGFHGLVPALVAAASVCLAVATYTVVLASPQRAPVERMAALVQESRDAGEPYCRYRVFTRNLVFYAGPPAAAPFSLEAVRDFLRRPDRVLCVLLESDAAQLEADGLTLDRIGAVSYLDTGSLTFEALLDPDPARYLRQVVLVSNRPSGSASSAAVRDPGGAHAAARFP